MFGERGGRVGDKIGWFEFGPAGREVGGVKNINISKETNWWNPISSHGSPLQSSTWNSITKDLIK